MCAEVSIGQIWEKHSLEGSIGDRIVILTATLPDFWLVTYGDMSMVAGVHEPYLREHYRLMADYAKFYSTWNQKTPL